jgi:uracil phosphoribosyltransferase
MVINLSSKHSLISNWICELRDVEVQNDRMRFRRNLERIGEVAAYEISKELAFKEVETQTPLGTHNCTSITRATCTCYNFKSRITIT